MYSRLGHDGQEPTYSAENVEGQSLGRRHTPMPVCIWASISRRVGHHSLTDYRTQLLSSAIPTMAPIIQHKATQSKDIMAIYLKANTRNTTTKMPPSIHRIHNKVATKNHTNIHHTTFPSFLYLQDRHCMIPVMISFNSFNTILPWTHSRQRHQTQLPHQQRQVLVQTNTAPNRE
jgi:hypothetical protein